MDCVILEFPGAQLGGDGVRRRESSCLCGRGSRRQRERAPQAYDLNANDDYSSVYHYPGHTLNTSARNKSEAKAPISFLPPKPALLESAEHNLARPKRHA